MRHSLYTILICGLSLTTACANVPTLGPTVAADALTVTTPISTRTPTLSPTYTLFPTARAAPSATAPTAHTFRLIGAQAEEVTVFMEFIHAFNAGQLETALALLDDQVLGADCDFAKAEVIAFRGKPSAEEWLRHRIADHDELQVGEILDENPDQPVGVIGVEWARRKSATLAKLGFPDGITPKTSPKVVFSANPFRIGAFANATPAANGGNEKAQCGP